MQQVSDHLNKAAVKSFLFSHVNMILAIVNGVAVLLLIVAWAVSSAREVNFPARTAMWIIGFILLSVTVLLSIGVQKMEPNLVLYYAHQIIAVLTLAIMAVAMGINNVVVNMCTRNKQNGTRNNCGAHYVELLAEIVVCISLGIYYIGTQQRIVVFIDKGILDGIRGRSHSRMEYLM
ncbi:unnamed protein product [Phytomonas sp. EM1]|nr:unnamed protein product [Phytomonas sp. EM1]|eukprot:CCW63563.1 unnamed protein product [Phytomonas sp. isolate EM1]